MLPEPIEVPDDEVAVLRAQGLLVEEDDVPAATSKSPKKDTT
jgi:hypothetical protein